MMLTKIKFIPKIMKSMSHSLFETKEYGNSDMKHIVNAVKKYRSTKYYSHVHFKTLMFPKFSSITFQLFLTKNMNYI